MAGKKYVYYFGSKGTEGSADMRKLLGGKGANLAEMANLGIRVPPGFTITTEACIEYLKNRTYPGGLWEQVQEGLKRIEEEMGISFGDSNKPLLLSVRSGARVSMPGMMDTVLNIGLNAQTLAGLLKRTTNERFAYDCYRRFITMFSNVVMGVRHEKFETILEDIKKEAQVELDYGLNSEHLKSLIPLYKNLVKKETKKEFLEDPWEQLRLSIDAVFNSWNVERAVIYRRLNDIPNDWGTAVNVQVMVFGNMGENSATGVAFTRDPSTGEKRFYGEFLMNAQGEDVVAGIRTPQNIEELAKILPEAHKELVEIYQKLENHFRDMQDIEFTIQEGKLFMLQTRTGKRTAAATVKIAVDMVNEGLIDVETGIMRIDPKQLDHLLHPTIDPKAPRKVLARGLGASPSATVGQAVFTALRAEELANEGQKVILVRQETSPEDIGGMNAAQGILTARGGVTSHAAVVARGIGKSCVVGCGSIKVDEKNRRFTVGNTTVNEGDYITLDGTTGEVMLGKIKLIQPEVSGNFATLLSWADKIRRLKVRSNADTPHDAQVARDFGAQGIGLCRTEHMFFEAKRIDAMREMILSSDSIGRRKALEKILPMQRGDFKEIFRVMNGLPVTIRLLDPPLHEFLPHEDKEIRALAKDMGVSFEELKNKVESLTEVNPMLGHRGCRLGITYPEIYEIQVQAIFEAACELAANGYAVLPEVMIPLVGHVNELAYTRQCAEKVAQKVMDEKGVKVEYLIGTMIELPRAALTADEIAKEAEFFSYGTNDLTQTVFGLSRDDAGKFLSEYEARKLFPSNPFVTIDQEGVGLLMRIGVEKGRKTKENLKIGICGEHGGEPTSVEFCHQLGFDYVSCSPFRVPIARLAAAQAKIKEKQGEFFKDI